LQLVTPAGGTGVSAEVVSAPADPNAVIKAVGPDTAAIPAAEKPAEAPIQINDIKSGTAPATSAVNDKSKKPKVDSGEESSSKKKKKKGLAKINPF
jgi:outer membrane protein assembly factor BamD